MKPIIEIDPGSGFCHGVVAAIRKAEEELARGGSLHCLGDIVHNSTEVERLRLKGLSTITHADLDSLTAGSRVLLRAHGEPPATYATAQARGITLIDATCPVVLQLQRRIKRACDADPHGRTQIVIYGKKGHAEVNGLVGQTDGHAIVVESIDELDALDFSRPIDLYSQTTKSIDGLRNIISAISGRMAPDVPFTYHDTICRQVANRIDKLRQFAREHDVVIFVTSPKSSNGKVLAAECLAENPSTHIVATEADIQPEWITGAATIGICGATSTPRWLMEQIKEHIQQCI